MTTPSSRPGQDRNVLSHDELVMLAHLRMRRFTVNSALQFMNRMDVTVAQVEGLIQRLFKGIDGFYRVLEDEIEAGRKKGVLPDVLPPQRPPPRNGQPLRWGRGVRTANH